jgi:hypothetical protein
VVSNGAQRLRTAEGQSVLSGRAKVVRGLLL